MQSPFAYWLTDSNKFSTVVYNISIGVCIFNRSAHYDYISLFQAIEQTLRRL